MLKHKRLKLLTVWLSTQSSCAVMPPDIFACKSLDPVVINGETMPSPTCKRGIGEARCGYCTYTISEKSFIVGNEPQNHYDGRSWDQMVDRAVILPAKESYAPLKAYIINSCKASNCDALISGWRFKLEELDAPRGK